MKDRSVVSRGARAGEGRFVVCVWNGYCPAALEMRKVYRVLGDERGSRRRLVRVVDESGEDICIRGSGLWRWSEFVTVAPYWRLVSLLASYGTAEAVP